MAPKMLLACGELKNAPEYVLVAVGLSGILKAKQKLGINLNFNKQVNCRASEADSEN